MVFDEITNDDFILLSKQGRCHLIYSTELTAEHVFENFWGNCPVALPLTAGSANKTCQHHLETGAATSEISSKAINKTLLAFGIFFTVNAHHTQTGQLTRPVCWHDYGQVTRIRTPRRFCKLTRWIMKTRHSKYSFAFSIHSDTRTKPKRLRRIPTSLHRCLLTVILYCMKRSLQSGVWHSGTSVT